MYSRYRQLGRRRICCSKGIMDQSYDLNCSLDVSAIKSSEARCGGSWRALAPSRVARGGSIVLPEAWIRSEKRSSLSLNLSNTQLISEHIAFQVREYTFCEDTSVATRLRTAVFQSRWLSVSLLRRCLLCDFTNNQANPCSCIRLAGSGLEGQCLCHRIFIRN